MTIISRVLLNRGRAILSALLAVPLLVLGGCASFDGQPRAVLTPTTAAVPADYTPQKVLEAYALKGTAAERSAYRNTVIGIYMVAADANFLEFRRMLSRENKGANFALGSGFTALSTAATVSGQRAANILSAIASGLSGVQGRLSAEVYFERTLPALLAGMEADRTHVRADIVARMGQGDEYSLTEALLDVARYEAAGSLDNAIETITNQASQLRQVEQARFENVAGLGGIVSDPALRVTLRDLGNRIDALSAANLAKVYDHLHLRAGVVDPGAQADAIMTELRSRAERNSGSLATFVQEMQTEGVDLSK
jgi:hypothetical protein